MDPVSAIANGIGGIANAVGSVFNFLGAKDTNKANIEIAKLQLQMEMERTKQENIKNDRVLLETDQQKQMWIAFGIFILIIGSFYVLTR